MDHLTQIDLQYDAVWNSILTDVHQPSSIVIERGPGEFGSVRASTAEFTIEDPADKYRPTNPESILYGKVGRATPTRIRLDNSSRFHGEAAAYEPDQTEDFRQSPLRGRRWVGFRAEGLLARIASWDEPLRSPMARQIGTRATLLGHWPMEDGSGAQQISNLVAGGEAGKAAGMAFAAEPGPAGASDVMQFDNGTTESNVSFKFKRSTATGWQIAWSMKLAALPLDGTGRQMISWTTSTGLVFYLNVNNVGYYLNVNTRAGGNIFNGSVGFGTFPPDRWISYRLKITMTGTNANAEFAWYAEGGGTQIQGVTWNFGVISAGLGALVSATANGNTWMQDACMAHLYAVDSTADNLLSKEVIRAFSGYVGETAMDRFVRLMGEEGLTRFINGTAADTMPMGRQRADTLMNLLKEIATTEDALIFDSATNLGVTMRSRKHMLDQTPSLVLNWPTDVAPPLREVLDNSMTVNVSTATQRDGGEVTLAQETGLMSRQPYPAGIGQYKGGPPSDVNLFDETLSLQDVAGWWLARGTYEGARYAQITIDLDATPPPPVGGAPGVQLGDWIQLVGREKDTINLIVVGIREVQSTRFRRKVTFTCATGHVIAQLGRYDAARYGSASTTLAEDLITTETLWDIQTQDRRDVWGGSWDGTPMPYFVRVNGEVCRVTACTAPAGTGPFTQTMTCVRSINGVVKVHATNSEIQLEPPGRYGY